MGRYAIFYASGGDTVEYKLWFGIQDSEIPWAQSRTVYHVSYDEEEADTRGLTKQQREIWKSLDGTTRSSFTRYSPDIRKVLEETSCEMSEAKDDDTKLESYWKEVQTLCESLHLPVVVYDAKLEVEEQVDTYFDDYILPLCVTLEERAKKEKEESKKNLPPQEASSSLAHYFALQDYQDRHFTTNRDLKKLADLHLKSVICLFLERYGSYECHFE